MLERFFKHFLNEKGFPNVDHVYWSLGYCQGDGCSFSGSFDHDTVYALAEKIFPNGTNNGPLRVDNLMKRRCIYNFLACVNYTIKVTQSDNRYVHYNTMEAEHSIESDEDPWDIEDSACDMTNTVITYAKQVARDMESVGYKLLESFNRQVTVVWKFQTAHYLFRLSEIEEEPETSFMADWDEECFISTCQSLINGESRMTALKAEVFYLPDMLNSEDEPLESRIIGGLEISAEDRFYAGYRSELIRELISEIVPKGSRRKTQMKNAA